MKKIALSLSMLASFFFIACEGPEGPPGPPGYDGIDGNDGVDITAQVFEVEGVNFDYIGADNVWQTIINYGDFTDFDVIKQDAVLVYRWDGTVDFEDGSSEDSWGLIPQNFFLDAGTIQYVSSHTPNDVSIFIDGNFNLSGLSTDFTDNQILRIVIIPGEWAAKAQTDTSSYSALMKSLGLKESDVEKIN